MESDEKNTAVESGGVWILGSRDFEMLMNHMHHVKCLEDLGRSWKHLLVLLLAILLAQDPFS